MEPNNKNIAFCDIKPAYLNTAARNNQLDIKFGVARNFK